MEKQIYFNNNLINKTNYNIKEMNIFSKFHYNVDNHFYMKM